MAPQEAAGVLCSSIFGLTAGCENGREKKIGGDRTGAGRAWGRTETQGLRLSYRDSLSQSVSAAPVLVRLCVASIFLFHGSSACADVSQKNEMKDSNAKEIDALSK